MYDLKETSFGDVLLAYMNVSMNDDLRMKLIDILSYLYRLDNSIYELEDKLTDLIYSENISKDDIVDMFTDLIMLRSIDITLENGIILGDDLNLNIVRDVLFTIHYLISIDPMYLEFIIKINDKAELSNIEKIAMIISVLTNSTLEELTHCIDDINNNLLYNLSIKIEKAIEETDEDLEEVTMLLHGLIYNNSDFINSIGVMMLNKGIEIPNNFEEFDSVVNGLDTENVNMFIINVVSLLFIAKDSRIEPDVFFNDKIVDDVLSDLSISELNEYSALFKKYVTIIKNNIAGYKNENK